LAAVVLIAAPRLCAQASVIYSFSNNSTGSTPSVPYLAADSAGNLYGTTLGNSGSSYGTVFELSPQAGGGWTEQSIYVFDGTDGSNTDSSSGLVVDSLGNLYGLTFVGGAYGYGVVFELSPAGGGSWTYTVLYDFNVGPGEGVNPNGALVLDASGNLYGVTGGGGTGYGAVFELSKNTEGTWTEKVLFDFDQTDGGGPTAPLVIDAAGNLYGMTYIGGTNSVGTVYELERQSGGSYRQKVLHSFGTGADGQYPEGNLILLSGILYGTTSDGGSSGYGTVFQVNPSSSTEKVIYSFHNKDGANPGAGLTVVNGSLYGTTVRGGTNSVGAVFGLTQSGGGWSRTFLYSFTYLDSSAEYPTSGLLLYSDGNLYGTAEGGTNAIGSAYEITP
jgi:uncharacterized repeat protein (TIGR03803 family)